MEKDKLVKWEFKLIQNKINSYLEDVNNKDNQTISQDDINLISIIGDRGFGKTTILEKIGNPDCEGSNIKEILYLETIKPLYVANSQKSDFGILEMLMANIVNYVDNDDDINQHDRDRLYNLIQKKMSIVLNKGISELDRLDSSITLLETIYEQTKIDKEIAGVIDKLLEIYGKKLLVIKIDDLDLFENSVLRNIVDDISKFLVNSQVVIIVAYNEENIMHKYLNELIHENSEVYKNKLMPETTLISRARNELNKIFTESNKVYLPRMGQVYQMEAINIFKEVDNTKNTTILQYCKDKFLELCPVNTIAYNSFETPNIYLPNSIRELKQFEEKIKELETVKKEQSDTFSEKFTSWFTEMTINKLEDPKYVTMISDLEKVEEKPSFIVKKLREFAGMKKATSIYKENNRDYDNIALGDIVQVLNEYYDIDPSQDSINMIYAIKLLLSIELCSLLSKYYTQEDALYLEKYQKVAKGYPTPIDRKYYDVDFNPDVSFEDITNPNVYFHEKVILVKNIISPNTKGQIIKQNSSFLDNSLTRINGWGNVTTSNSRYEKRNKLFDFTEVDNEFSRSSNKSIIGYFKSVQHAANANNKSAIFLTNPFTFLLSKEYIDWALANDQLVVYDMFFLDFLYDLKTHRSSEQTPLKRVYLRLDEGVNDYKRKFSNIDEDKRMNRSEISTWWEEKIECEKSILESHDYKDDLKIIGGCDDEDKIKKSITRQDLSIDKKKQIIALYTRYKTDYKVELIKYLENDELDKIHALIGQWEKPLKQPTISKRPLTILDIKRANASLAEESTFSQFCKDFYAKFSYNFMEFDKEHKYYSGTEIGRMRNFTRNYGKK